jgi:hypothetical protein
MIRPRPSIQPAGDPRLDRGVLGPMVGDYLHGHPGTLESLVPVWGSAREAIADGYDGDYLGAAANTALAVSDLFPAKALATVGAKAVGRALEKAAVVGLARADARAAVTKAARDAVFPPNPSNWKNSTSKWYKDQGYREKGVHAHHVFFERNSAFGKAHPEIVNQPWNLTPLDRVTHGRVHGPYSVAGERLARFNPLERLWYGTPEWSKGVAADAAIRPGVAIREDRRK